MNASTINPEIYNVPIVIRAIERIQARYRSSDENDILTLWLKVPWKPGEEPTTFTSEDRIIGCVPIYDPLDGRLIA